MKNLLFTFLFITSIQLLYAQQAPIVLQSGETARFFNDLTAAVQAASNGDAIYLPGGSFSLTGNLNKQLYIYGAGWRSDSSAVTGSTTITGDFRIGSGASGSILNGIYLPNRLFFLEAVNSFFVERCGIQKIESANNGRDVDLLDIKESMIVNVETPSGLTKFTNCIVVERIYGYNGNIEFRNSIMFNNLDNYAFVYINNILISNSIIFLEQIGSSNYQMFSDVDSYSFSNTLVVGEASRIGNISFGGVGNVNQPQTFRNSVFVNSTTQGFSLGEDYRTKAECNCSDRGVYSGSGFFRATPPVHIVSEDVQTSTSNNFLKFQFKIKTNN